LEACIAQAYRERKRMYKAWDGDWRQSSPV
jgi:hypothetical protein